MMTKQPHGWGPTLLVCSIVFPVIAMIAVSTRIWIRVRSRTYGWDDILLVAGLAFYLASAGVIAYGTFFGLGASDNRLIQVGMDKIHGRFAIFLWSVLYFIVQVCVKCAVCILLLRIAGPHRVYRICIKSIMGLVVVCFIVTEVGTTSLCSPIQANWDKPMLRDGRARCLTNQAIVAVGAFATVYSITTDWLCALFPAYMLWRMPMKFRAKMQAGCVLGLGAFASVCPLLRLPYIFEYQKCIFDYFTPKGESGTFYVFGGAMLWSTVECCVGIVATSIPPIWRAFRTHKHRRDTPELVPPFPMLGDDDALSVTGDTSSQPRRRRSGRMGPETTAGGQVSKANSREPLIAPASRSES